MSIIYDALKKLEGNPAEIISKDNQPKKKKSNQKKIKSFILIVLFLGIALTIVFNFLPQKQVSSKQAVIEPEQANNQNTILKKEVKNPTSKQVGLSYKLEGIVFSRNNSFAIINGQRVYAKDKVGNFIVSEIKKDSVELVNPKSKETKILSIQF